MKINRHNYEEYFILYADKELNSDERRMVEEFVSLNPDLKDELDSFCSTVLMPDVSVEFSNKEELLHYDDSLISYIDDELPAIEKAELEKLVAATPSLQKELELYRKTKLQPEEIVFEDKSVLYRHEERKVVRMAWVRWAAAAVILLAVSITAITVFNNSKGDKPGLAGVKEEVKGKTEAVPANLASNPQQTTPSSELGENKKPTDLVDQKNKGAIAKAVDKQKGIQSGEIKKPKSILPDNQNDNIAVTQKNNNLPKPDNNPYYAEVVPDKKPPVPIDGPVYGQKNNVKDFTAASVDVTNMKADSYINTDNREIIEPEEEGGGNKKSRGLLRKITRVFEKNTGIKATTDDDKLHIMAFTVKLK